MKKISRWLWIGLFIWVASCVPPANAPVLTDVPAVVSPTSEQAALTLTNVPLETGLTVKKLRSSVFFAPVYKRSIQLNNGEFSGSDANGEYSVTLLPQIAFGDLNRDQKEDAAVLLAENNGGTGVFVSLVVIVSDGNEFVQMGSRQIDDRPVIKSLTINEGEILLEGTIHKIDDAMAEPTLDVEQTYRLLETNLTLMAQKSTIPGAGERSITIDSPGNGSEVSNPVQITGSMTIAPFENNLRLTVYDTEGTVLFQSGFMVTAAELGGPGTFNNLVRIEDLAIPENKLLRIELTELSMADGSIMTSNSVLVKSKQD